MSYAKYQPVSASDFGSLMQSVANVYGVGSGDTGYGQTSLTLTAPTTNSRVFAAISSNVRNAILTCASHQGTSTTLLPPAGDFAYLQLIKAYLNAAPTNSPYDLPQMITNVTNNRLSAPLSSLTTTSNAYNRAYSTTWGTGNTMISIEVDATFASEDEARYFFNSGGTIRVSFGHPSTSTSQDQYWNTTLTAAGTVVLGANASTSIGSSGAVTTGLGYYQLTTANQSWFAMNNYGGGTYGANDVNVYIKSPSITGTRGAKGNVIRFRIELHDEYMRSVSTQTDYVNAGTFVQFGLSRATTYLTITPPSFVLATGWSETVVSANPTDDTPDNFSFAPVTGASISTSYSSTTTISGINLGVPVSVTGGTVSINGGSETTSGIVYNGQTIRVTQTSSASMGTTTNATVVVGTGSATFSVTTIAVDATPDPFSFTNITNTTPNTSYTSNTITVTGINASVSATVSNGSMSVNGGSWVTSATVSNGQTITLRGTSSSVFGGVAVVGVTVGTYSTNWSITNVNSDTTPDPFSFNSVSAEPGTLVYSNAVSITGINDTTAVSVSGGGSPTVSVNGGSYNNSGVVYNGQTIQLRNYASTTGGTTLVDTATVGGANASWSIYSFDRTPDAFAFGSVTLSTLNTTATSNTVTVTGIDAGTPISVSGGSYSISGSSYTTSSGTINNNQTLTLQTTGPSSYSAAVTMHVTVGTYSTSFTVNTSSADTTPDDFVFSPNPIVAEAGSIVFSNNVTITGINTSTPVTVTGGVGTTFGAGNVAGYTAGNTAYITNGQTISVQTHASTTQGETLNVAVTVGTKTVILQVRAYNRTPTPFTFNNVTNATVGTTYTSNSVTLAGIDANTPLTATSPGIMVNGIGPFQSAYVNSGDVLYFQFAASSSENTTVSRTVNIGSFSTSWSITTMLDLIPDDFSFTPALVYPNTPVTSNTVTISGVSAGASIPFTVSGPGNPSVSVNGGPFTTSGTFVNGSTLQVQTTSIATYGSSSTISISYNGVSHPVWTVSTRHEIPAAAMYSTAGSYTYTVPQYVTQIKLEGEGGGGAGGNGAVGSGYARNNGSGSISTLICGGGGGGGAGTYASTTLNVTPGDQISIVVGSAGIHNSSPYSINALSRSSSPQTLYYGAGSNGGVTYAVYSGAVQLYCLGGVGGSGGTADVALTQVGMTSTGEPTYAWLGSSGSGGAGGSVGGAAGGSTTSSYAYGGAGGNGGNSRLGIGGTGGKGGVDGGSGSQSGESGKTGSGPAAGGGGGGGDGINSYGLGADGTAGWARITPTLTA